MGFIFLYYTMWKKPGMSAPPEVLKFQQHYGICFETNWMGARREDVSHAHLEHWEMSTASDNSLT